MRMRAVLSSFAVAICLATPARADPGSNDAGFLAVLDRAGITYGN